MLDESENAPDTDPAAHIKSLSRQVDLLTELSSAGFRLSLILRSQELYATISGILGSKLGTDNIAIYIHEKKERVLRLVHNQGRHAVASMFSLDNHELFNRMVLNETLTRATIEADGELKQFFIDKGLDWQSIGIWIPLSMQDDLIGLVAIGLDPEEQPRDEYSRRFLDKICAHIAVCIHTCLLYEMREKEKEDLDKTLYNLSLLYDIGRAMTHISAMKRP